MARFPTYERSQGLSGGATASYASPGAFTGPGRALQAAGADLAGLGQELDARAQKIRNSQDDVWFSKARADTALEMQTIQQQARQNATGGAEGHVDTIRQSFEQTRAKFLESAPSDRARLMYEEWSNSYSTNPIGEAATFQARSTLAKRDNDFAEAMIAHGKVVLADGTKFDETYARAMDDLEGAKQWMTPEQEIAARQSVERNLRIARAQGDIARDPKGFLDEIGVTPTEMPIEEGGQLDAAKIVLRGKEGLRTTPYWDVDAWRIGYGSDTVTRADGTVVRVTKDMRITAEDAERDLNRRVKEFEGEAIRAVGVDAWASLPASARAALISVTYNYGELPRRVRGAVQSGDTSRIAAAVESLGSDNGGINRGRRQAEAHMIRTGNVTGKGGAPNVAGNPRFSALDFDDVLTLQQEAEQTLAAMERQRAAENSAQLASVMGALDLGIALGDPSITQKTILDSPLGDTDKRILIDRLEDKQKDGRSERAVALKLQAGTDLNVIDPDDVKGASKLYATAVGDQSLFGGNNDAAATLAYIYGHGGIVPERASQEIRAGLISSDPKRVGAAASYAAQLAAMNERALAENKNGKELAEAATKYRYMTETLGLTSEEAGQRMIDMSDPQKVRAVEALIKSEPMQKKIKAIDDDNVAAIFDKGMFDFAPDVGANEMGKAAIVSEYKEVFIDSLIDAGGDMDLAKELAEQRFSRTFGTSQYSRFGDNVVLKYVPEVLYPVGPDGTHDYIGEQAIQALEEQGISTDRVFLQATPETEATWRSGNPPAYDLFFEDEKGDVQKINVPFYALPEAAQKQFDQDLSDMKKERGEAQAERKRGMVERGLTRRDRRENQPTSEDWVEKGASAVRERRERVIPMLQENPPYSEPPPAEGATTPPGAAGRKARRKARGQ